MGKIRLLDCTLRDGGYINNWRFGKDVISDISRKSAEAGGDIIELGFLRDVPYKEDEAVFSDMKQIRSFMHRDIKGTKYAVMCEALNPLPIEKISYREEEDVEIIRVIVWKRLLKQGFEYCKGIVERGYKLCIQPNRVDQYTDDEFVQMIQLFSQLNPLAFYVVDSFGILDENEILHYADLADRYLEKNISIGYHGHNNLLQAYGTAQEFIKREYERDIFLDASVYGIGRGAGNLNIELIAKYLNENCLTSYQLIKYLDIYEKHIKKIYEEEPWGYSAAYYLTALYKCNPMYGRYYSQEKNLSELEIEKALQILSGEDKIRFSISTADVAYERALTR